MGDGYLLLNVAKSQRRARVTGQLPDGQPFAVGVPADGRSFLLTAPLGKGGVLAGTVRAVENDTGTGGVISSLLWKKAANGRSPYYRGAVDTALALEGLAYAPTTDGLPPLEIGPADAQQGNARLTLTGGDLTSASTVLLNLLPRGFVQFAGANPNQLQLKLQPPLGTFSGRFRHPGTNRFVPFRGAFRVPFDTEPGQGRGVFGKGAQAGAVRIEAN